MRLQNVKDSGGLSYGTETLWHEGNKVEGKGARERWRGREEIGGGREEGGQVHRMIGPTQGTFGGSVTLGHTAKVEHSKGTRICCTHANFGLKADWSVSVIWVALFLHHADGK